MWDVAASKCKESGGELVVTPDRYMIRFFRQAEIIAQ